MGEARRRSRISSARWPSPLCEQALMRVVKATLLSAMPDSSIQAATCRARSSWPAEAQMSMAAPNVRSMMETPLVRISRSRSSARAHCRATLQARMTLW